MSSSKVKKKILIIPSIRRGNGTGHIRRAVKLASDLIEKGAEVSILADQAGYRQSERFDIKEISSFLPAGKARKPSITTETPADDWDICIFDTRDLKPQRLSLFSGRTMTVGLDEGGDAREYFDYLIDVLPNLEKHEPNISSTGFLQLPERCGEIVPKRNFNRVLISFGGEDASDLTGKLLALIEDTGIFNRDQLTVVKGPLFRSERLPDDVGILDSPKQLGSLLKDYDLLFTMFGLTCFEALYSGTPVILFNPSQYHRSLSVRAGIPEIGVNKPEIMKLEELLNNTERLNRAVEYYSKISKLNLAEYILNLKNSSRSCRGCGSAHNKYIYRDTNHSFFRCGSCGLINQNYYGRDEMSYNSDYFFEDYKKQYGKTYLEDFQKIKNDGLRRCSLISRLVSGGTLLDAGCGYGPFLAAADERGFLPEGIEISENAAAWVREELGYRVYGSAIEAFEPDSDCVCLYDVITMWYVIEHLENAGDILKKINGLLRPGGAFCFSTPNFDGISRIRSAGKFFRNNPLDHHTIWSPYSAVRLLRKYGFRVKYVVCANAHPERFFRDGVYAKIPGILRVIIDAILIKLVRIFKIGDTFEVYAVKKR